MILMTGATGTVGSEVVKRLSPHGVQVRAVTRDPRKVEANLLPHVLRAMADPDRGYHGLGTHLCPCHWPAANHFEAKGVFKAA